MVEEAVAYRSHLYLGKLGAEVAGVQQQLQVVVLRLILLIPTDVVVEAFFLYDLIVEVDGLVIAQHGDVAENGGLALVDPECSLV